MDKEMVRTHVVLPKELVNKVDKLVGQRRRSQFMTEALAEKLRRSELAEAAREAAGALADADVPGWETKESTSEWVRSQRAMDDERLRRILKRA